MQRKSIVFLLLLAAFTCPAMAEEAIMKAIPDAKVVGKGKLAVLLWDVYEATLYAPGGQWTKNGPFALSILYFRKIEGKDIADRSVEEIRRQGFQDEGTLEKWHDEMHALFPDVQKGTVLKAVFVPGRHTEFFEGSRFLGTIGGDCFLDYFSGIWLSENTPEPALRKKLLGLS